MRSRLRRRPPKPNASSSPPLGFDRWISIFKTSGRCCLSRAPQTTPAFLENENEKEKRDQAASAVPRDGPPARPRQTDRNRRWRAPYTSHQLLCVVLKPEQDKS